MRRFMVLLLLAGVSGWASNARAAISITGPQTFAYVTDGSSTNQDYVLTVGGTATATLPGYSSTTTSAFSTVGDSAVFSSVFDQSREGLYGSSSGGIASTNFSSDVDVPYVASGTFLSSNGYPALGGYLYDSTTSAYLYNSVQRSSSGAAFTLGGTDGNYYNYFSGSLTGTLLAGHNYIWAASASNIAFPGTDDGATTSGNVTLTIGTPQVPVVPEPSGIAIWSLMALGVAGTRRFARPKASSPCPQPSC